MEKNSGICRSCNGTGNCSRCHGSGNDPEFKAAVPCRRCKGTGICPGCGGSGVVSGSQIQYDLSRLIRLCEEINLSFSSKCYFSVILLIRALLDHIPPIFQYRNFTEVANNYGRGGKSFKESMERLENSSRKLADGYLHIQIRNKEILPNST